MEFKTANNIKAKHTTIRNTINNTDIKENES